MDLKLTGKTALITGASMGIGEHLAGVFESEGVNLHLTARSADKLEEIKNAFRIPMVLMSLVTLLILQAWVRVRHFQTV